MEELKELHLLDTVGIEFAAKYLKCSPNTVRTLAIKKLIPSAKPGRNYIFVFEELVNYAKGYYSHDSGADTCQYLNEKTRPIITTVSPIRKPNTTLRQAVKEEKMRNKLKRD